MTIPDEVDVIVVGGGSAGSAIAGRLANLDHQNISVLLIEDKLVLQRSFWMIMLTLHHPARII